MLFKCPDCGNERESGEPMCPHCGCTKKPAGIIGPVIFLALCGFAFFAGKKGPETYYVGRDAVNYRSAPNEKVLGQLQRGETVVCDSIGEGWCRSVLDGREIYISLKVLTKQAPADKNMPAGQKKEPAAED